ncbi:hypothetical protein NP493_312g06019 [Ridgeia piscesae]|uniref:Uncharacterized protein n=1 Tax=Ridgeia piscesae TaxID=27915 RepID=A0AAD9NW27_RIDPI|nr:hypothetical protein NP493_312g06019 [Ridgeia piscesae]
MGEHVTKSPLEFGVIVCLDRQEILVNMILMNVQAVHVNMGRHVPPLNLACILVHVWLDTRDAIVKQTLMSV